MVRSYSWNHNVSLRDTRLDVYRRVAILKSPQRVDPRDVHPHVRGPWPTCRRQDDMFHPIALLYLLLRMVRASQGLHASPDGYARGLSGSSGVAGAGPDGGATWSAAFALAEDGMSRAEHRPVPAPRRPGWTLRRWAWFSSIAPVPGASRAKAAALVRGRCFMTGRETGARPVESRKLALTVLCALADQEHARAQASMRVYAHAPGEGFALGQSPFLGNSRLPRQGTFAGPFRPTGALECAEPAAFAGRAVFVGREAA